MFGFALMAMMLLTLIGTAAATTDDSNDPQSTNSNDGTIWIIGDFEQFGRGFDTGPHDDPTLIKYTIGDDLSKFPSGLGTDIGRQRSAIKIQFNEDLSEETILVIKWSPGGSIAFEQFRAEVDEKTVGHSQYLQGSSPPKWITEEFVIPVTSGNTHNVTLTHLRGDGLNLGAIGLFEKNADPLSEILAGSDSSSDAKSKNGLSMPMLFLIICGVLLIGYAISKSKSRSSGEEKMAGVSVSTQLKHEELMAMSTQLKHEKLMKRVSKSFTENDNIGTRHDTWDKAVRYWMARTVQQKFDPFVLYIFDNEADARDALIELDCIHVAEDTDELICTETFIFGYYLTGDGDYQAVICGEELTHNLWAKAKESFEKHGGRRKNDQEPEESVVFESKKIQKPSEVVFVREYTEKKIVYGEQNNEVTLTYRIYKAADAASAKEFLKENPVNRPTYYVIVETPEGNWGRDIDGIYKE